MYHRMFLESGKAEEIEKSPPGYPQFSRLIGAHPDFCLSSRFSNARARILLQKQQRVESLEKKLEELDAQQQPALWLGSFDADGSQERRVVLENLDVALKDYDDMMMRTVEVLKLPKAPRRSIESLLNWTGGKGSICRTETAFLQRHDLCAVGGFQKYGIALMETLVEKTIVRLSQYTKQSKLRNGPASSRIFLFEENKLRNIAQFCITALLAILLLVPVIVIRATSNTTLQIFCVVLNSILFASLLTGPMNAPLGDVFGASATYTTLLVMFLASEQNLVPATG
ncbi:MAG: hypothetical protein GOMPHAMPRED_001836 [Gomphillus americanus]|uniref:DUF6594 domain-containing protein n=1 Tax=Gomphillus americanus TaxID=1940652 RepID=A0A8H3IL95_9LECA|nr:MAG: hypothetical protein GOMPHAMPRED_001836 [Gomphillus americanus]